MGYVCKIHLASAALAYLPAAPLSPGTVVKLQSKPEQVQHCVSWFHLILLSRKGSAFCSTGLNDIYGINSWVRGWTNGGRDNN